MTTRQTSSRSSSRSRPRQATPRKKTSRRGTVARRPSLTQRAVRSSSRVIGRHADELTGLLLVAVGLVAVAGLVVLTRTPLRDAADRTVA
ncbi:MAG TPA: hypothetical protein VFM27_04110, partial [Acidimicrobiales bacterium]|nr:hypothetical protein [Acidimicrobiales bacterium]